MEFGVYIRVFYASLGNSQWRGRIEKPMLAEQNVMSKQ